MFKWIAILLMTLDHFGYFFEPLLPPALYTVLRVAGRLAFPMFAYLLVRGMQRTGSLLHYFQRLLLFAFLTHLLLVLTTRLTHSTYPPNVLFTLCFGLTACTGIQLLHRAFVDYEMTLRPLTNVPGAPHELHCPVNPGLYSLHPAAAALLGTGAILLSIWATAFVEPDYGWFGLGAIVLLYAAGCLCPLHFAPAEHALKRHPLRRFTLPLLYLAYCALFALIENGFDLSFGHFLELTLLRGFPALFLTPLEVASAKPAKPLQYLFYIYYPLHLCLFMILAYVVQ